MTGPSSNPRPRVDQLTDDDLDALHAQLEASEAATAMFKARAEQAEAELAVSREVARSNRRHVQTIVPELEKAEAARDAWAAEASTQTLRAEQAEDAIARVRTELDRIANLRTITHDNDHADTFSTGVRWAIRIIRENALTAPTDRTPPVHLGNRANAEDCPGCSGTNPPYPFICPAQPGDPGGPYPTT